MKILILASGGDASGMNMCLYQLTKGLRKEDVFFCRRGYQGLIENDIVRADLSLAEVWKNRGGIVIKSSRSKDFMTKKGFDKALKILRDNKFDRVIILGGNGTFEGAKRLSKYVSVIFIPATIDNDFEGSDYTIGYDTAVKNAVDYINNVKETFYSFDRIGVFEVMGRDSDRIANAVGNYVNADLIINNKIDYELIIKKIKKINYSDKIPLIIIKEHICDVYQFSKELETLLNREVRGSIIGYIQRGGMPSKNEIKNAKLFAKCAVKNIQKNNIAIIKSNDKITFKNI